MRTFIPEYDFKDGAYAIIKFLAYLVRNYKRATAMISYRSI
jgi:hypothetical protein